MCDVIESIYRAMYSLSPRGWVIKILSNIFQSLRVKNIMGMNSHLKKTWHTARFQPWGEDENLLRSDRSSTELAGPGIGLRNTYSNILIMYCIADE